ncbi:hypothetical protein L0F63_000182 [Massospora cicadina]|nr:hypothetical protein L0F63_000182 [Massospora cicadina]
MKQLLGTATKISKMSPYMAKVNHCPAILFEDQYAITAAECIEQYKQTTLEIGNQTPNILDVIKAPHYVENMRWDHNVALVKFQPIKTNACLTFNQNKNLHTTLFAYSLNIKSNNVSIDIGQRKYEGLETKFCQTLAEIHLERQDNLLYDVVCATPLLSSQSIQHPPIGSPLVYFQQDSECPILIGPIILTIRFNGREIVFASNVNAITQFDASKNFLQFKI